MEDQRFLRKILVAADGSVSSLMAEETAAIIAKKTGAVVTVLHVVSLNLSYEGLRMGYQIPPEVVYEILGHIEQEAEKIINDARALFVEEGVSVETRIRRNNDPADDILKLSKNGYDLIVMGAHGENETEPFALGSTTKKVMRGNSCPTLIAKNVSPLSNMLVCVDGSHNAVKALDYAVKLTMKMSSKITVFHVQDRRLSSMSPRIAKELGERVLSNALNAVEKQGLNVNKRLEFGVPSNVIVEAADNGGHDLIVLGTRGMGTVRRFMLGSVSDDVSHKAKTSVLIVPAKT